MTVKREILLKTDLTSNFIVGEYWNGSDKELNQEAFNKAVRHTLKQGKRSTINVLRVDGSTYERCAYRGDGGLKCPVGALIPDEEYYALLEGKTSTKIINSGHVRSVIHLNPDLFRDVQVVHDKFLPHEWEAKFRAIADDFELTFPSLEENVLRGNT